MFDRETGNFASREDREGLEAPRSEGEMAEVDGVRTPHRKGAPSNSYKKKKFLWEDLGECAPSLLRS